MPLLVILQFLVRNTGKIQVYRQYKLMVYGIDNIPVVTFPTYIHPWEIDLPHDLLIFSWP